MRKTSLVLAALLAVVGVCVMLWPVFAGHRLQADTNEAVQNFLAERNEPEQKCPELLAALQVYNQRMYLRDRGDAQQKCWPSIKTIAADLHLSRSTVKRALGELEQHGYLERLPRYRPNGSSTSNLYTVR